MRLDGEALARPMPVQNPYGVALLALLRALLPKVVPDRVPLPTTLALLRQEDVAALADAPHVEQGERSGVLLDEEEGAGGFDEERSSGCGGLESGEGGGIEREGEDRAGGRRGAG